MTQCSRCGMETHIEYGADGQAYCGSCIFYGMNKPCFKCRMYLPASELQQFKGQWVCPYCLMDMREEERRTERGAEENYLKGSAVAERCERCGRAMPVVYYFGGKRLCDSCMEEAQKDWRDVGGERPPLPMQRITERKTKEAGLTSFFGALFSELLGRIGIKARKKKREDAEIVAIKPHIREFVPLAKPMKEGRMEEKAEEEKNAGHVLEQKTILAQDLAQEQEKKAEIMIEGPERKKRKKKKSRNTQDVSFDFTPGAVDEKEGKRKADSKGKQRRRGRFEGFKSD